MGGHEVNGNLTEEIGRFCGILLVTLMIKSIVVYMYLAMASKSGHPANALHALHIMCDKGSACKPCEAGMCGRTSSSTSFDMHGNSAPVAEATAQQCPLEPK